jgi:hypothetical protein
LGSILRKQISRDKTYIDLEDGYDAYLKNVMFWSEVRLSEKVKDSKAVSRRASSVAIAGYNDTVGWLGVGFDGDTEGVLQLKVVPSS